MDRFVIRGPQAAISNKSKHASRQRKIEQLAKVVSLDAGTSALCFQQEDLLRYQALLQDPTTSMPDVVLTLRKLSVHEIEKRHLDDAPLLQPSVQMLECHADADVRRLAARLVDKWMRLLMAEDIRRPPHHSAPKPANFATADALRCTASMASNSGNKAVGGWQNFKLKRQSRR